MEKVESIPELLGRLIETVSLEDGCELRIKTDKGEMVFYHFQDCCEIVRLEEGLEDLEALVGGTIRLAESVSKENPDAAYGSETWTFVKIGTEKGFATLRWLGESNGYYGEGIDWRWEVDNVP